MAYFHLAPLTCQSAAVCSIQLAVPEFLLQTAVKMENAARWCWAVEDHIEQLLEAIIMIWEFEWLLINAISYRCDSFPLQQANSRNLQYELNLND